jgi:hypothetical protein
MHRKPIERRFVADMRAFHAEPTGHKRDEIAARQFDMLKEYSLPALVV